MTSAPGKLQLTFAELFERRLKTMPGKKTKIQITVHAEVRYTFGSTSELESKDWGPFHANIPQLSKKDMYKFMMYTLLKNGFNILSTQTTEEIGATIITHKKSFFKHHKMGRLKLESFFLNNKNKIKIHGSETCVIDYIWHEVKGQRGFKTYTYEKLSDELSKYDTTEEFPYLSTQEIVNWIRECHSNISVHAYTATYKKFMKHISDRPDIILTFVVKDHHLHSITDPELKKIASSSNKKGSVNLFQHMSEVKWIRRHDKFIKYEDITDQTENSIIICPPEMKIHTTVCQYMLRYNYYVEYLHFSNNGQLDSFVDHKNNMYVEDNDYESRKLICNQMRETYNVHDFLWANHSWTSLPNSLFKMMNGYLPESSYNNKTREMLDRFYPRAIQWCSFKDKPKNLVNIDICKQFPSILINNTTVIPIYTIHDHVEIFEGTQKMDNNKALYYPELNESGEFYIDTFEIKKFDQNIKIEAAFYHAILIKFLVYKLGMPVSNIKRKLIAKHGIRCDTLSEFMLYLFKNFPEKEAKKRSVSFIGDLGRKYNLTDYGFTCQDLQPCQDVWTQGLIDKKSVSIDNFENLYLVREQKIERILSDHTSINRFVISGSILQCLSLLKRNWTEQSELFSINTDGFFYN